MSLICQNCDTEVKIARNCNELKCPCDKFIQKIDSNCYVNIKPYIEQYVDEEVFNKLSFPEKVWFIVKKMEEDKFTVDIKKICRSPSWNISLL